MLDTESAVPDADDMALIAAPELLNYVDVAHSTKDSIQIVWSLSADTASTVIRGFKVRYQAVGSTVVQYSHMLSPTASSHDIIRLHENTAYEICVRAFTTFHSGLTFIPRTTTSSTPDDASSSSSIIFSGRRPAVDTSFSLGCVTGSTAIDALRVAVGSTLGAFIALGIVVAFVLLAKCQHRRRYGRGDGRRTGAGRGKMQRLTDSEEASLDDDDEEEEEEDDCVDCVDRRAELDSDAVGVDRTQKTADCGGTRGSWEATEKETVIAGNGILQSLRQPPIYVDIDQSDELRDAPDWCQTAGQRVTFYDVSPAAQPTFSFELVAENASVVDPAEDVSSLFPVWQLKQDVDQTTGSGGNHVGRLSQPPIVGSLVQPQQLQQRVQLFPVAQQLLLGRSSPDLTSTTGRSGSGSNVPAEADGGMIYVGGQFDGCYPAQNDDSAADWHDTAKLLTTTNGREHNFVGGSLRQNHSSLW